MTEHVLSYPPHPDGFYVSSALCSCGRFQWDFDSDETMAALRADVQTAWEQHVVKEQPEVDVATLHRALKSAEDDLLWAMFAFSRLGWPASIGDLFVHHGQPSLIEEYQLVQKNIAARRQILGVADE